MYALLYLWKLCLYQRQKMHLRNNILNGYWEKSDIYITSLSKLMDESLKDFPKLFVYKMKKQMFEKIDVVSQLSNVLYWGKDSDEMESMLISREKRENIISYVDLSKICHVIKCFPDLKKTFGK